MVVVEKCWPGETVVVMATGPSLCAEDVDYVKYKARVIAVNDAYRLCPWADVLYASDIPWWEVHQGVPSFAGRKYTLARNRAARPVKGLHDVIMLRNTGTAGLELHPSGLRTGLNSGYAALNLAVHFGVSRILLLGFNMSPVNGKRHFFGDHKGLNNSSDYSRWARHFQTLVAPLKDLAIEIVNCTTPTRVTSFPQAPLREVLA